MSKRQKVPIVTEERRHDYIESEIKYFRNIEGPKQRGPSAADIAEADKHLPSREMQYKMEQRLEKGFTKSSRSGAFSKASTGFAIRPNGMKFSSDFINEMTPGKYQPQEQRPVLREQTRQVDTPLADVVITDTCMDCFAPTDTNDAPNLIMGQMIMVQYNPILHYSMGVHFGSIVLFVEHKKCHEAAMKLGENATPIVLVKGGELTDPRDVEIAMKYGFPVHFHTGTEVTMGQWEMCLRKARMEKQLEDYLLHADKSSQIYRRNRNKVQE